MSATAGAAPGPANLFLMVDEHGDCIDDGWCFTDMQAGTVHWYNLPASYHSGSSAFTFTTVTPRCTNGTTQKQSSRYGKYMSQESGFR